MTGTERQPARPGMEKDLTLVEPQAKRRKIIEAEFLKTSPKIKIEPPNWEKLCASLSPSKIVKIEKPDHPLFARSSPRQKSPFQIRIRTERELISSESEEESEPEEGEIRNSKPSSPKRSPSHKYGFMNSNHSTPSHAKNVPNVSKPAVQSKWNPRILCFNCKKYGHRKTECKGSWTLKWPVEYLNRNPWIRQRFPRLHGAGAVGFGEFRKIHRDLEKEAIRRVGEYKRKVPPRLRTNPGTINIDTHTRPCPPNRFEQPFPRAVRRLNNRNPRNDCCGSSSSSESSLLGSPPPKVFSSPLDFNFSCIIAHLQQQVDELQRNLRLIKV